MGDEEDAHADVARPLGQPQQLVLELLVGVELVDLARRGQPRVVRPEPQARFAQGGHAIDADRGEVGHQPLFFKHGQQVDQIDKRADGVFVDDGVETPLVAADTRDGVRTLTRNPQGSRECTRDHRGLHTFGLSIDNAHDCSGQWPPPMMSLLLWYCPSCPRPGDCNTVVGAAAECFLPSAQCVSCSRHTGCTRRTGHSGDGKPARSAPSPSRLLRLGPPWCWPAARIGRALSCRATGSAERTVG